MSRKNDIIDHAIHFFNEHGYGASSLFQLANSMQISRGNLTYHFKSKEALLTAIVKKMWLGLERERHKAMKFPSFENLQREVREFQRFQKDYAFLFRETQILTHPQMRQNLNEVRSSRINDFIATMAFSMQVGNLKPEPIPGAYHNLCRALWMIGFYWIDQSKYASTEKETGWDKMMWSLLLPFFTAKGISSFITFFGQEYFDSLGKPFDQFVIKSI